MKMAMGHLCDQWRIAGRVEGDEVARSGLGAPFNPVNRKRRQEFDGATTRRLFSFLDVLHRPFELGIGLFGIAAAFGAFLGRCLVVDPQPQTKQNRGDERTNSEQKHAFLLSWLALEGKGRAEPREVKGICG